MNYGGLWIELTLLLRYCLLPRALLGLPSTAIQLFDLYYKYRK